MRGSASSSGIVSLIHDPIADRREQAMLETCVPKQKAMIRYHDIAMLWRGHEAP